MFANLIDWMEQNAALELIGLAGFIGLIVYAAIS